MKGGSLRSQQRHTRFNECGQAIVFIVLALSLFLLAAVGFAVDIANLWFHRQVAQNAADAACTAGAMDLYLSAQGTPMGGFTPGTAFTCSSTPGAAPCQYAALNGYNGTGLVGGSASNEVAVSFPSAGSNPAPGVTPPPAALAPYPFIRVDVVDRARVFLMALLTGTRTQDVRAFAVCGLELSPSVLPILVLDPTRAGTLSLGGNTSFTVYGGPPRGVQVNSSSGSAVGSGGTIDLHQGGPNHTGSDLGVFGGPSANPGNFNGGTTGNWVSPASPVFDPFALLPAPAQPPNTPPAGGVHVNYHENGCPDPNGCAWYTAGYYPSGITIKDKTAVFDPGIYYVLNGLALQSNSTVRPSTALGDGSGGTIFYFADTNSVSVGANSGSESVDAFTTSTTKCTPSSILPDNLPATLNGNILLAPCSGTYGDPLGTSNPIGEQRGILFFQNRSQSANPQWGGGGQFLLAGTMYFHQCVTSGPDRGTNCSPSAYNTTLSLGGNAGSGTYNLGGMVVDRLSMGGTSGITMDLNPNAMFGTPKAALLR